jgi:multiple sugar transport system substrate-binding protein
MKKVLVMSVMLLLVASLLPIFAGGGAEPATPAPVQEPTPEKLVYLTPPWGAPSDAVVAAFEAETGIKLEVATLDIEAGRNRVLTAAAGRTNPADVIFVSADTYSAFRSAGAIQALQDLAPQSLLNGLTGVDQFIIGDDLWAVPLYQQMVMIVQDTTALAKIGKTAADIRTWDDFEAALVAMKEQGVYEYPYAAGVRPWTWYLTALSSGSTLFDADFNPTFDQPSDPAYGAFQRVLGFYAKGLISPERLSSPNPHPSFWAGQAGLWQAWQGGLTIANNPEQSKAAPNANYLLLPNQHKTWLLPAGLTVSAFTDYPQASMKLVEFLTKDAMQMHLFTANGLFPANNAVFTRLGQEGKIDGFEVMNEQSKHLASLPYNQPWYIEFEQEATQAMLRVARGEQTSQAALAALGNFARALKAEYE